MFHRSCPVVATGHPKTSPRPARPMLVHANGKNGHILSQHGCLQGHTNGKPPLKSGSVEQSRCPGALLPRVRPVKCTAAPHLARACKRTALGKQGPAHPKAPHLQAIDGPLLPQALPRPLEGKPRNPAALAASQHTSNACRRSQSVTALVGLHHKYIRGRCIRCGQADRVSPVCFANPKQGLPSAKVARAAV
jgi:hypothetical protein